MTPARWVGFLMVWLALVIFTIDGLVNRRRALKRVGEGAPAC